jgi:hypothetical protein
MEQIAERAYSYPVQIDTSVTSMKGGETVRRRAQFRDTRAGPTATKGVVQVIPRVPLSFPVGIEVAIDDQVAQITVPNNVPALKIEEELSMRWGIQVQFKKGQSLVWLANARYEFVPVIPGQKSVMTEKMRAQMEAERAPQDLNVMLTIVEGVQRYQLSVQVKRDASWIG